MKGKIAYESYVLRWGRRFYFEKLTRAGRAFFWACAGFFAYAVISIKGLVYVPLAYVTSLWVVAWTASLLWRPRVRIAVRGADRICAGEVLPLDVEVEQLGRLPGRDLWVRTLGLPRGMRCDPEEGAPLRDLERGARMTARLHLACEKRGAYRLSGLRVESDFPFGIVRAHRSFPAERSLLVYPRFVPIARLAIPTGRRYQPGGVALASVVGDSADYIGNREYRDGDNIRDIDWRATARLQKPIVREYREEYFLRVAVVLDTHLPKKAPTARHADFERAVSLCASVGDFLARQEYIVDIFAAGPNLYHLMAGRSLGYLDQILDILACVEENPEEPFDAVEPELMENLSRISAVVCVFLDWNESRRAFVDRLKRHGVGLKVVVANSTRCTLDPATDASWLGHVPVVGAAEAGAGAIEDL
ncbi:MAG: DUF58 domain-containing protein [Planctomycetes bacterium]|nr:DUF58 domain-containing protein [Planctomycetota bacterium]